MCYYIEAYKRTNKFNFTLLNSEVRKEGKIMIKNQKVKEIQNLFEGGDIDYTSLEDFLKKETFKLYNLLEIRTREDEIIKFRKENQKSFLDIESEGKSLVYNCKINKYEEIIFLIENTKAKYIKKDGKKFYLYHVIY